MKIFSTKVIVPVIIGIVVIGGGIAYAVHVSGTASPAEVIAPPVASSTVAASVYVSGTVVPVETADLSFEIAGIVSDVPKNAGDEVGAGEVVAEIDPTSAEAALAEAQAGLTAANASLTNASSTGTSATAGSIAAAVAAAMSSYTSADDAIENKIDQMFTNPRTQNPEIVYLFKDIDLRNKIDAERITAGETLADIESVTTGLTVNTYSQAVYTRLANDLNSLVAFLDDVSLAVNEFAPTGDYDQATVDAYKAATAGARTEVNGALTALIGANASFNGTSGSVPVLNANVTGAEAGVEAAQVALNEHAIVAPFSGIVSVQNAKVGESVTAYTPVATIISTSLEIDAYVPELSIGMIAVGDTATATIDALDSEIFPAHVTYIDPAETMQDGAATYKVKLSFDTADTRIRSGMTAAISIAQNQ